DVISEEDDYPQYANVMYLYVMVLIYQKLELQTSYIYDFIESGKENDYKVKIKNVADKKITLDQEVNRYTYDWSFDEFGIEDDKIEISVPSVLGPGEIGDMIIRVPVPEDATGTYYGYINMNVDGKENDGFEPQLELNFRIKQQPSVPYVKTFSTRTADPITIELSTSMYNSGSWLRFPPKNDVPSFELNLKYNSSPVDMSLIKTTQTGSVNILSDYFPIWSN